MTRATPLPSVSSERNNGVHGLPASSSSDIEISIETLLSGISSDVIAEFREAELTAIVPPIATDDETLGAFNLADILAMPQSEDRPRAPVFFQNPPTKMPEGLSNGLGILGLSLGTDENLNSDKQLSELVPPKNAEISSQERAPKSVKKESSIGNTLSRPTPVHDFRAKHTPSAHSTTPAPVQTRQYDHSNECVAKRQLGEPLNVFEAILEYGHDEDFRPLADSNFLPTDAPAGTSEKIEVLRRRVKRGQPLWHKDDRVDYAGLTGIIKPIPE